MSYNNFGRGNWAYRGRGRGRGFGSQTQPDAGPPRRDIMEGLKSSPLHGLAKPSIPAGKSEIKVEDLEFLGSYNWKTSPQPAIVVPGNLQNRHHRPCSLSLFQRFSMSVDRETVPVFRRARYRPQFRGPERLSFPGFATPAIVPLN